MIEPPIPFACAGTNGPPADGARRAALGALARWAGAVVLLGPPLLAHGASIVAVRVWPAPDYTRVTLESDTSLLARHFLLSGPDRLVVDIEGLELNPTLREIVAKVRSDDPYIAGVRVGQNQPRVVRIVLDLKAVIDPQVFTLNPISPYQHRLVFDLYPVERADPLMALLAEKQREDALGAFIARMPAPVAPATPQTPALPPVPGVPPPMAALPPPAPSLRAGPQRRPPGTERLIIVAIDPGHGGEDPGAIGPGGTREKDVVLSIARRVRERLNREPNVRAYMTRTGDYFVPLHERVAKARRVQADLFVSIHADAFINARPRGASVFVLSERGATSTMARFLAERENAADLIGGVNVPVRDQAVARAMLDMSTTAQIKDSLLLGRKVLHEIGQVGRLHKPQVEQAGFAVLRSPDVPSILVETAFISNPDEERRLRTARFQDEMADAVVRGVRAYFAANPPLARSAPT